MTPLLKIQALNKSFCGVHAIRHCSFEVEENSITGLIGPNGAGKTTLFDLISGLLKPNSGKILFRYDDITDVPVHRRATRGIIRTFQNIRIFPELSTLDNLVVAFPEHPDSFFHLTRRVSPTIRALHKRALDLLAIANLTEFAHRPASELSYGQKKLLEILRAAATGAELLLLDEPAAGVNRTMLHHIINLIKTLQKDGKTILLVEHDMPFTMNLCEQIIVLDFGSVIAEGTPEKIQNDPKVLEAYLGKKRELVLPKT